VPPVNRRRTYSSPLRDRQTATTRQAVVAAARELFVGQGYGATTIEQIAQHAGVSKPTVFNVVGSKPALLRAVRDVAIAGDDAPTPIAQRPTTARIDDAADQRTAVERLSRHLTEVARRYGDVYDVLHAAAAAGEEELRELWATEERERLAGARHWVAVLAKKGRLRPGVDTKTAVDTLWFLMAPGNYTRLVRGRGWTAKKYERWLTAAIGRLVTAG
jgi:AcrR family transcriptional regulator